VVFPTPSFANHLGTELTPDPSSHVAIFSLQRYLDSLTKLTPYDLKAFPVGVRMLTP